MTRHSGWEVRVSAEVNEAIVREARREADARIVADVRNAMGLLRINGTRATGAKKLRALDLWEIRIGDFRAYFCPVRGTNLLAVGALEAKRTRRLRMTKLRMIERRVHRWRDTLKETR